MDRLILALAGVLLTLVCVDAAGQGSKPGRSEELAEKVRQERPLTLQDYLTAEAARSKEFHERLDALAQRLDQVQGQLESLQAQVVALPQSLKGAGR
ncbi:MAG: hypothetical protein HY812_17655 [Planctomycetes bacterium]|nr:hypothetical protein [Planctomycetota bacterium]